MWRLVERLGQGLGVEAASPILPLIVGSEAAALRASAQLLQRGFYVPAIRPPTVAPGTSRQGPPQTLATLADRTPMHAYLASLALAGACSGFSEESILNLARL